MCISLAGLDVGKRYQEYYKQEMSGIIKHIPKLLLAITVFVCNGLVYGQTAHTDSLAVAIPYPDHEPEYVYVERMREEGMKKALQDDSLGQLVLYQFYRPAEPVKARVTGIVVWNMYQMKFVPLTDKTATIELDGYRYQANQIMKQRYGENYWDKVEEEVSVMLTTKCE